MPYDHLRRLQQAHNAWLEALLTESRDALDGAMRELFAECPELSSVSWQISTPDHAVTGVEFRLRNGAVWCGDGAVTRVSARVNARRYRPFAELLVANGEVLAAAAMTCPARVTATPDGALTVTPLHP